MENETLIVGLIVGGGALLCIVNIGLYVRWHWRERWENGKRKAGQ